MLDQGKTTKSEEQNKYEAKLEELRMLLKMLGKDTSVVDEMAKLYEGMRNLPSAISWSNWMRMEIV